MVYLTLRTTSRRQLCSLMTILVRKQNSVNHQLIYLTEVRPPLTIVFHFSSCSMSTHQLLSTALKFPMTIRLDNCLYLFIEVNLCFLYCFICWAQHCVIVTCCHLELNLAVIILADTGSLPIYHDFRLHSFLSIAQLLQWSSSTSTEVPSPFTYPQNAIFVRPHLFDHLGTLTRLKHRL